MSSLTLAEIQSVLDSLTPKLYYGVSDTCAKGQYYFVKETRWNPQFIIVHSDDLETLRELVYPAQLVHLSQEPLEGARRRFAQNLYQPKIEGPYENLYQFSRHFRW